MNYKNMEHPFNQKNKNFGKSCYKLVLNKTIAQKYHYYSLDKPKIPKIFSFTVPLNPSAVLLLSLSLLSTSLISSKLASAPLI